MYAAVKECESAEKVVGAKSRNAGLPTRIAPQVLLDLVKQNFALLLSSLKSERGGAFAIETCLHESFPGK